MRRLTQLINGISAAADALSQALQTLDGAGDLLLKARHCRDTVTRCMQQLRALVDEAETMVDSKAWPFPGYGELLTTK